MTPPTGDNGWTEWRNHVLEQGKRHEDCWKCALKQLGELRNELTALKVEIKIKFGVVGVLGGVIGSVAMMLFHSVFLEG